MERGEQGILQNSWRALYRDRKVLPERTACVVRLLLAYRRPAFKPPCLLGGELRAPGGWVAR
jgi:hypothetical protein